MPGESFQRVFIFMKELKSLHRELVSQYNLTDSEALKIAIELQRNEIIKEAFGVTSENKAPKFLEGIAIALGYK